MTKKDFEFVALLIAAAKDGVAPEKLAEYAVAKFEKANPRFDVDRFMTACGLDS